MWLFLAGVFGKIAGTDAVADDASRPQKWLGRLDESLKIAVGW